MTLQSLTVTFGRRGIFSVGVPPIPDERDGSRFEESEYRFSSEVSGLEDVALWGMSGSYPNNTYHYTGQIFYSYMERLFFSDGSVKTLFSKAVDMIDRFGSSQVLWLAKRLARSPFEIELVRFLLYSGGISYGSDPLDKKKPKIDFIALRNSVGLICEEPNIFISKSLKVKYDKNVIAKAADQLHEMIKNIENDSDSDSVAIIDIHGFTDEDRSS